MDTIIIKGKLTEDGKIEIELPEGWQPGDIRVELSVEPTWTDEEIEEMLNFEGRPLGEIEIGGWEDMGIEDSVAFVEEMRLKRREINQR